MSRQVPDPLKKKPPFFLSFFSSPFSTQIKGAPHYFGWNIGEMSPKEGKPPEDGGLVPDVLLAANSGSSATAKVMQSSELRLGLLGYFPLGFRKK